MRKKLRRLRRKARGYWCYYLRAHKSVWSSSVDEPTGIRIFYCPKCEVLWKDRD